MEPLLAEPGDIIVFDAWVPHRSGPNRTDGPRRSYYLTFNPASAGDRRAAYYARKRECFPPEYERQPGRRLRGPGPAVQPGKPVRLISADLSPKKGGWSREWGRVSR